jgi:hypothetical protein
MKYELQADDVIHAITQQRNAALDEIARMGAIIKAMERMLNAAPEARNVAEPDF